MPIRPTSEGPSGMRTDRSPSPAMWYAAPAILASGERPLVIRARPASASTRISAPPVSSSAMTSRRIGASTDSSGTATTTSRLPCLASATRAIMRWSPTVSRVNASPLSAWALSRATPSASTSCGTVAAAGASPLTSLARPEVRFIAATA
ncbi:hypothetical protein OG339_38450 [Streptosporangium sp. NBC_01495]|nr:hypothetical protein [Streptosporangium sp. NBC_01495]